MNLFGHKPIFSRKLVYGALVSISVLIFAAGSLLAYDYFSGRRLEREGDILVEAERYDDAITKYALAKVRLFHDKPEIKQKIDHVLALKNEKSALSSETPKIEAKEQNEVLGSKINNGTQSSIQSNQSKKKTIENLKKQQDNLIKKYQEIIKLARECNDSGAGASFCNNLHMPFINSLMLQINDLKIKIAELESQN